MSQQEDRLAGDVAGVPAAAAGERERRLELAGMTTVGMALSGKDFYTFGHAARVAGYARLLGRRLGWAHERLDQIEQAAFVHDVGKLAVSDRILRKAGPLSEAGWTLVRRHSGLSALIVADLFDGQIAAAVRHHHERWDGSGYPDGLVAEACPLVARAICVVDAYDAMSLRRPYRRALSYAECLAELARCRGTQFDPALVDAFVEALAGLREHQTRARAIAASVAAQIDPGAHALLRTPDDERRPEYGQVLELLRAAAQENPDVVGLYTRARFDGVPRLVVDWGGDPEVGHVGDPVLPNEEMGRLFRGDAIDTLTLTPFGTMSFLNGHAPVIAADGSVAAVVTVYLPLDHDIVVDVDDIHAASLAVWRTFGSVILTASERAGKDDLEEMTDDLTAVYNHRFLREQLEALAMAADEDGGPLALVLADVDDFLAFNEAYGWGAGDGALRAVAGALEREAGRSGFVCRHSEDCFAVILPGTSVDAAREIAGRCLRAVADLGPEQGLPDRLTISAGIAALGGGATADGTAGLAGGAGAPGELLAASARALAAAKAAGKACVAAG